MNYPNPDASDGAPLDAAEKNLATRLFESGRAESQIEDIVDEALGFYCERISWDDYDDSLEIMMGSECPDEWRADKEFADKIRAMGFSRFWVNWPDGFEQYCTGEKKYRGLTRATNPKGMDKLKAAIEAQAAELASLKALSRAQKEVLRFSNCSCNCTYCKRCEGYDAATEKLAQVEKELNTDAK